MGQLITPKRRDEDGYHDARGCAPFTWDEFDLEQMNFNPNDDQQEYSLFLLLQRGGCSFQEKSQNAQSLGAELVIIADFNPERPDSNDDFQEISGYLGTHIPAIEISHEDAQKLRQTVRGGEPVFIKVELDHTNNENNVEVDLWYATSLDLGLKLSNEFAAMSIDFGASHSNKPLFTPRIATYPCWDCDDEFKSTNCVSDGKYCAYTPAFYQEYHLDNSDSKFSYTGREVIIQSLREKCLHGIMVSKFNDPGDMYWTFYGYDQDCFTNVELQKTSFDDCYDWTTVMINNQEFVTELDECVDKSFATMIPGERERTDQIMGWMESDNQILRQDRLWADQNNVMLHPSITVNNITYTGSHLDGAELELAICNAYREAPDECQLAYQILDANTERTDWSSVPMPNNPDLLYIAGQEDSKNNWISHKNVRREHVIILIGVILAINLVVLGVVRCRMKRQMQD